MAGSVGRHWCRIGLKWLFPAVAAVALVSCGDSWSPPAGAPNADLVVTMTVSQVTAPEGDTLDWTVSVTNAGPVAATSVLAGDTLPTGTTYVSGVPTLGTYAPTGLWTIGSLAVGASAQLTLRATINSGAGGTNLVNSAGALSGDQNDSVPANNIASTTTAVTAATLNNLVFTTQPTSTTAGTSFGVVVTARDAQGNTASGFTGNVTVAITSGTGTTGAHLAGTTTVAAVSGVATFSGLAIDSAGSGYSLLASATGLNGATGATFDIAAAAAARLVFTTQPGNATAGAGFGAVVTARDGQGNTAAGFTGSVTVAITSGTGTAGAHLTGITAVAAVSGVATFSGLAIDSAGSGYSLLASGTGLNGATSATFNIAAAAAAQLVFTTQPTGTTAGTSFGVVVTARNAQGNTLTGFTGNVTVGITSGTGTTSAHLTGTTTVAAVSGVATFSGLAIDSAGSGYRLAASGTGLNGATSATFNIAAAAAARLVFTTQPVNATAGAGFGAVVKARDAQGNTATGFTGNVTVAITSGAGTTGAHLTGTTTVAAVAGVATFSPLVIDTAGSGYSLTASATGLNAGTSTTFNVAPPSGEPVYNPATGTLVFADSMEGYTTAAAMWNSSSTAIRIRQGFAVDTPASQVVSPGHGGTGKALRVAYAGTYQEGHDWDVLNAPTTADTATHFFQYWARVTMSAPFAGALAFKWFMAFHPQGDRVQWNTHDHLPCALQTTVSTYWQVYDFSRETSCQGNQPIGPYPQQVFDGQWHRFTYMYRPNTSVGSRDGIARMWVDGTKIIDISLATVGVTPPGGYKPWAGMGDVDSLYTHGVNLIRWFSALTTTVPSFTADIDEFVWWRKK